jgi:hypothetical protein
LSDIVAIACNATSRGKVNAAREGMSVFVKLVAVQTGGKIGVVTAGVLRDRAGRISAVLGCQRIEAELEREAGDSSQSKGLSCEHEQTEGDAFRHVHRRGRISTTGQFGRGYFVAAFVRGSGGSDWDADVSIDGRRGVDAARSAGG